MRCVIAILMIGFIVAGCGEEIESPKQLQPLQKGGANTLTLPDGNVVYNMNG